MKRRYFVLVIAIVLFGMQSVFAEEPIKITVSDNMDKVVFDGKWTYGMEWKHSSENTINYNDDGTVLQLRTAHQGNFIYVFVDAVSLANFDRSGNTATICFDKNDSRPLIPNSDDYCFISTLGRNNTVTLQGGSSLGFTSNFIRIPNPDNVSAVGGISDNDRYTSYPHAGFEFKIPTDVVGRSDSYGFYLGIYDVHSKKIHSWPTDIVSNSLLMIPSPSKWGEIISPDKSLPEFPWPSLTLLSSILLVIYITRRRFSFN
jgi:hypothetical protein